MESQLHLLYLFAKGVIPMPVINGDLLRPIDIKILKELNIELIPIDNDDGVLFTPNGISYYLA